MIWFYLHKIAALRPNYNAQYLAQKSEEWSMDNDLVTKIWVGLSTTNIHLPQFKIQSHLQKSDAALNAAGTSELGRNQLKTV